MPGKSIGQYVLSVPYVVVQLARTVQQAARTAGDHRLAVQTPLHKRRFEYSECGENRMLAF